jgi:hypothetical protein
MQHEFITSLSNGDFISQLDHLNNQIHGTNSSFDTSQLEMTDDESKPDTTTTIRNNVCMTMTQRSNSCHRHRATNQWPYLHQR